MYSPETAQPGLNWDKSIPPVSMHQLLQNRMCNSTMLRSIDSFLGLLYLKEPPRSCQWLFPWHRDWGYELWWDYFYSIYDSLASTSISNWRGVSRLLYHIDLAQKYTIKNMYKEYMQGVTIFEIACMSHVMISIFILFKSHVRLGILAKAPTQCRMLYSYSHEYVDRLI